jgi:hypothetical protein
MFRRPTPNAGNPESLVPAAVRQLLVKGEEVEARYELKGAQAYATATRLIILRGGFVLFAFGGTSAFFPVAGAALILLGILTRARRLELLVTGVREPVVLNGAREVLGPLVQKLSEKGARKLGA